jgi:hypothetical protein
LEMAPESWLASSTTKSCQTPFASVGGGASRRVRVGAFCGAGAGQGDLRLQDRSRPGRHVSSFLPYFSAKTGRSMPMRPM